jgi:hypothetical protein
MRLLALLAGAGWAAGCCAGGPEHLQIWTTGQATADDPACDWDAPMWGGTTEVESGTNAIVLWDDRGTAGRTRAVELYDGAGARIDLPETTARGASCGNGCPSPRTLYELPVAPGDYTMVHRESQGNGKPVFLPYGGDPWTTFEGERALVTTLRVTPIR